MQPEPHAVGKVSPEAQKLMDVTKQSFFEGIKYAKAGHHLNEIGAAIGELCRKLWLRSCRRALRTRNRRNPHEDPEFQTSDRRDAEFKLVPGMTLAVEPMINMGRKDVYTKDDDWTVATEDGQYYSAHYENTDPDYRR